LFIKTSMLGGKVLHSHKAMSEHCFVTFEHCCQAHLAAIAAQRLRVMLAAFDALLDRRQTRTVGSTFAKLSAHWRTPSLWKW
jgi:hypothetical protein